MEATPGIEPGYADLQSAASPLRHVAVIAFKSAGWRTERDLDGENEVPMYHRCRNRRNVGPWLAQIAESRYRPSKRIAPT